MTSVQIIEAIICLLGLGWVFTGWHMTQAQQENQQPNANTAFTRRALHHHLDEVPAKN